MRSQVCNVMEGRIRVVCPRCDKKRFLAVAGGVRKKSIRCQCGQSTQYTLNHRSAARESNCGKALLFLANGRNCPVYLTDMSVGGIGFNVPRQYSRALASGQDMGIKFRAASGATIQRKIRIKSVMGNRVGAQFLDGIHSASAW